ncbi:MAG: 50S ribosomal protein L5 [Candidatus Buchananbacteria bacterium RBG_13_39_9]|uniref:Large ribosomal subunit protein uL5 n=1 Tax=Candidatus Buchananbacteria bacterium RBG_13_39_9 TaxID=1797531 RepID=A0A1G1XNZ2_9BACT|nr:MAG: 50S ribosomal protein L5 [Candidatus Buchananbacteria bacterium RBG_13_39_9]
MNLQEFYSKKVRPELKKEFGYENDMQVPKLDKVVLNIGLSKGLKDASFIETAESTLMRISGQKPIKTKAKKSISNFKIRQGQVIGLKVTLRGKRMYDFVEKLIKVTLPRVRDFRGLNLKSMDKKGNLNIGINEHISFPEIRSDEIEKLHGLEIAIISTAKNKEEAKALFLALGFPFKLENI